MSTCNLITLTLTGAFIYLPTTFNSTIHSHTVIDIYMLNRVWAIILNIFNIDFLTLIFIPLAYFINFCHWYTLSICSCRFTSYLIYFDHIIAKHFILIPLTRSCCVMETCIFIEELRLSFTTISKKPIVAFTLI